MRLGVSILLAMLAILFAARIGLAEPVRVSTLEARVNAIAAQLAAARANERTTREAQDLLAHRIAALKRKGTDQTLLEQLLRESVEADRILSKQVAEVRRLEQSFSQAVRESAAQIDARMRTLAPDLDAHKPASVRRAAAKEIAELRMSRGRLRAAVARMSDNDDLHRQWADHVMEIDPLDGLSELENKTDALALMQRKIDQQRQQIDVLIREKKIAQAARDFSTDATALDEDIRNGRVSRKSTGGAETLADVAQDRNPTPPAAPADSQSPGSFQGGEAAGLDDQAAPPPEIDPSRADNTGTQPQVGVPGHKSAIPVDPATALPSGPVAKQIDPNALINLRVDQLDADALDLTTLEKYAAELQAMQKALSNQATKIKSRAAQLEKDEARSKK